jgi:phage terminase small subunit
MEQKKLSFKMARFIDEYLVDGNATQAAIRAGYSPRSAYAIASENLRKPEIAIRVEQRKRELLAQQRITPEWVVEQLRINTERAREAGQFAPSNRAIELLGQELHNMFVEKHELTGIVEHVRAARDGLDACLARLSPETLHAIAEGRLTLVPVVEGEVRMPDDGAGRTSPRTGVVPLKQAQESPDAE